jgi:hypothetical protein
MKLSILALAATLALTPVAGFAHGQAPAAAHGGQVQDAQGSWVEFVVNGEHVEVYVMNEEGGPLSASQITGTATVMIGGQPQKVQLTPAEGNKLTGTLSVPATGKAIATVSLKIAGKAATARFAGAA